MTQISNMSNFGDGHGCGYRDGYGGGYGAGDGFGQGNGYGYRDGFGYIGGYGYGCEGGDGNGRWHEAEHIDVDGYGGLGQYTNEVAKVGEHSVYWSPIFRFARIGCQTLAVEEWKKQWRAIAENNNISISEAEVRLILEKCQAYDSN